MERTGARRRLLTIAPGSAVGRGGGGGGVRRGERSLAGQRMKGGDSLSDKDSDNKKSPIRRQMPILEREKLECVTVDLCTFLQDNVGEMLSPGSLWRKPVAEVVPLGIGRLRCRKDKLSPACPGAGEACGMGQDEGWLQSGC